jgi:hypothetical protein
MKSSILKIFIFLFIPILSCRPEYVLVELIPEGNHFKVVKNRYDEINPKIWRILDTLQFPQIKNVYFRNYFNLQDAEYKNIVNNEYTYLKKMIKYLTPKGRFFHLLYIPHSLFEIFSINPPFFFSNYKDEGSLIIKSKSLKIFYENLKVDDIDFVISEMYEKENRLIMNTRKQANFTILNMLPDRIIKSAGGLPMNILAINPKIVSLAVEKIKQNKVFYHYPRNIIFVKNAKISEEELFESLPLLIKNISQYESIIYKNNQYPLYRGSTKIDELSYSKNNLYSMSFGTTLFGGIYFDAGPFGACAWSYFILKNTMISYLLPLYKKDLIDKNSIYYVSTIPLLLSHQNEGEFFHSRTKVPFYYMGKGSISSSQRSSYIPEDNYDWFKVKGVSDLKSNVKLVYPVLNTNSSVEFIRNRFESDFSKAYFLKASDIKSRWRNPIYKDPNILRQINTKFSKAIKK